jgi:hypothetical protein
MASKFFNLGNTVTEISGSNAETKALQDYFKSVEISETKEIDFHVTICNSRSEFTKKQWERFSLSGKIGFNKTDFCSETTTCYYQISNLFTSGITVLEICPKKTKGKHRIKTAINRFRPYLIGLHTEQDVWLDSIMNYTLFWPVMSLVLLKLDKAFVHGAVVSRNGNGWLSAGTGGCGKTSVGMQAVDSGLFKYVADDFCVIDKNGQSPYFPKKLAIYETDRKYGNKTISDAIKKLAFSDYLAWKLNTALGKNCRYRFDAPTIFTDDRIERNTKIVDAIYFMRSNTNELSDSNIPEDELYSRMTEAAFRELSAIYEWLQNIHAVGGKEYQNNYPYIEELKRQHTNVLKKNLSDTRRFLFEIPLKYEPKKVVQRYLEISENK